jgi:long-chain acyl-CoA synthetase
MPKSVAEIREELTGPGQLFEMEELDLRGVPIRAWKNAPPTLRSVLDLSSLHGEKILIVYEDERISFDQHYRMASTFAHRLIDRYGVQKGDRVALAMRNFPEWMIAFWGATVAGAIIVPLNAWGTGAELAYGIRDSGAKVLVADEERAQRLRPYDDLDLSGIIIARNESPLAAGEDSFNEVLGDVAAGATPRSSTRRAPPGSRRARSARTATSAPTRCRWPTASWPRRRARTRTTRPPRTRCPARPRWRRCSRFRSSTSPAATP